MTTAAVPNRLTGRHVLIILLSFFGIVIAVNTLFAYSALHTLPGEELNSSYEDGLRYNKTIAEARAQEALGWHDQIKLMGNGEQLRITMTAQNGDAVGGLSISGLLGRPASGQTDHTLQFREIEPGVYEAQFAQLTPGTWTADLVALGAKRAGAEAPTYRMKERLWLPPR